MTKENNEKTKNPIPDEVHRRAERIAKALLRPVKKSKPIEKSTEGE